jgi:hypothetical protein
MGSINKFKKMDTLEIDFENFAIFAYNSSSGYITPYA